MDKKWFYESDYPLHLKLQSSLDCECVCHWCDHSILQGEEFVKLGDVVYHGKCLSSGIPMEFLEKLGLSVEKASRSCDYCGDSILDGELIMAISEKEYHASCVQSGLDIQDLCNLVGLEMEYRVE